MSTRGWCRAWCTTLAAALWGPVETHVASQSGDPIGACVAATLDTGDCLASTPATLDIGADPADRVQQVDVVQRELITAETGQRQVHGGQWHGKDVGSALQPCKAHAQEVARQAVETCPRPQI